MTKKLSPITSSEQLKEWIATFLDAPDMGDKATEIISELAKASEVNIWKTLLQELQRIDLLIDYNWVLVVHTIVGEYRDAIFWTREIVFRFNET